MLWSTSLTEELCLRCFSAQEGPLTSDEFDLVQPQDLLPLPVTHSRRSTPVKHAERNREGKTQMTREKLKKLWILKKVLKLVDLTSLLIFDKNK